MPYKITFDLPNSSKGQGVAVNGLGEFQNGKSYTITDEQHDQYRAFNSAQVDDEETGQVVNKIGPTLLQSNFPVGVTVEKVDDKPVEETKPAKDDQPVKGDDK